MMKKAILAKEGVNIMKSNVKMKVRLQMLNFYECKTLLPMGPSATWESVLPLTFRHLVSVMC